MIGDDHSRPRPNEPACVARPRCWLDRLQPAILQWPSDRCAGLFRQIAAGEFDRRFLTLLGAQGEGQICELQITDFHAEEAGGRAAIERVVQFDRVGCVVGQRGGEPGITGQGLVALGPGELHVPSVVEPYDGVQLGAQTAAFHVDDELLTFLARKRGRQHAATGQLATEADIGRVQLRRERHLRQVVHAHGDRGGNAAGRADPQQIDARRRLAVERQVDLQAGGSRAFFDGLLRKRHGEPKLGLRQQLASLDHESCHAAGLQPAERKLVDLRCCRCNRRKHQRGHTDDQRTQDAPIATLHGGTCFVVAGGNWFGDSRWAPCRRIMAA